MTFDPKKHMLNMKGKDYLEVKWRLVWFKDDHPQGGVKTEVLYLEPLIVIKATILTADGVALATGHGTAQAKQGAVWAGREIEKAETAAIGRALAHAGYGTQFTDEDEGTHLADSPVERKQQQRPAPNAPASKGASAEQWGKVADNIEKVLDADLVGDVSGIVPSGAVVTHIQGPADELIYTVTKVKVVPMGNSHMYIMGAITGENIALFGGDKFRELMLDPEKWKAKSGQWNKLSNNLRVKASLTDDKWAVEWIEQEF